MGRTVRALLALVALLLVGAASTSAPPTPTRRVTDGVGVMSAAERDDLEARLEAYEHASGHQILVWIGRTSGAETIDELAVESFAAWKIGRKGLDDGLALFILVDDHKVRIEVGYGLEDRVTDLLAAQVIRDVMVPRIVQNDFDGAVRLGVEAIVDDIEGKPNALGASGLRERGPPADDEPLGWASWLAIGIGGVAFLILLFTRPQLALFLLWSVLGRGGGRRRGDGIGGFSGGGGRSGGGGATGGW